MAVEFNGYDKILYKLNKLYDLDGIEKAVGKAAALVEKEAKNKAPKDTGALRRSIASKVETTDIGIEGTIFTPLEYAP